MQEESTSKIPFGCRSGQALSAQIAWKAIFRRAAPGRPLFFEDFFRILVVAQTEKSGVTQQPIIRAEYKTLSGFETTSLSLLLTFPPRAIYKRNRTAGVRFGYTELA